MSLGIEILFVRAQPKTIFCRSWVQNGALFDPAFINNIVSETNGSSQTYVAGSALNSSHNL